MRAFLVVFVVLAGFAAAGADAVVVDGGSPTEIQNDSLITTPTATVESTADAEKRPTPSWTSILPPLLAILLALLFRHVLVALVLGVWLGAFLLADLSPIASFARLLDTHLVGADVQTTQRAKDR